MPKSKRDSQLNSAPKPIKPVNASASSLKKNDSMPEDNLNEATENKPEEQNIPEERKLEENKPEKKKETK